MVHLSRRLAFLALMAMVCSCAMDAQVDTDDTNQSDEGQNVALRGHLILPSATQSGTQTVKAIAPNKSSLLNAREAVDAPQRPTNKADGEYGQPSKSSTVDPLAPTKTAPKSVDELVRVAYRVDLTTQTRVRAQGMADHLVHATTRNGKVQNAPLPAMVTERRLLGRLTWDAIAKDESGVWVAAQWIDDGSSMALPGDVDTDEINSSFRYGLKKEFNRGVLYVHLSPRYEIKTLWVPRDMSPDVVEIALDLLDGLRLELPEDSAEQRSQWTTMEWNATGQIKNRYKKQVNGHHWHLLKTPQKCVALAGTKESRLAAAPGDIQLTGHQALQWNNKYKVVEKVSEKSRTDVDGYKTQVTVEGIRKVYRIDRAAQPVAEPKPFKPGNELSAYQALTFDHQLRAALVEQERLYAKRELHAEEKNNIEAQFKHFLVETQPLLKLKSPPRAQIRIVQRSLAKMVVEHPAFALELFNKHLLATDFQSKLAALMMRVAVSHGGEVGEAFVASKLRNSQIKRAFRSAAIMSLAFKEKLGATGEKALHDLVKNPYQDLEQRLLSNQAAYGIANQRRKRNSAEQFERGLNLLLSELATAKTPWRQGELLGALQNSGDLRIVEHIAPFMSHTRQKIQVAAFESLRLVKHQDATQVFLENLLTKWPSVFVRSRAVHQFAHLALSKEQLKLVAAYLKKEPKHTVLADAINALSAHKSFVHGVLTPYLTHSSSKVKGAAQKALAKNSEVAP